MDDNKSAFDYLRTPLYTGPGHPTATDEFPHIKENRALISNSIIAILMTKMGQRLWQPDFGSNLHKLIFEQNDTASARLVELAVTSAIRRWEPRVRIQSTQVTIDENTLSVNLRLEIIRIGDSFTLPISIDRRSFFTSTVLN